MALRCRVLCVLRTTGTQACMHPRPQVTGGELEAMDSVGMAAEAAALAASMAAEEYAQGARCGVEAQSTCGVQPGGEHSSTGEEAACAGRTALQGSITSRVCGSGPAIDHVRSAGCSSSRDSAGCHGRSASSGNTSTSMGEPERCASPEDLPPPSATPSAVSMGGSGQGVCSIGPHGEADRSSGGSSGQRADVGQGLAGSACARQDPPAPPTTAPSTAASSSGASCSSGSAPGGFAPSASFQELRRLTRRLQRSPTNLHVAARHATALQRQLTRLQQRRQRQRQQHAAARTRPRALQAHVPRRPPSPPGRALAYADHQTAACSEAERSTPPQQPDCDAASDTSDVLAELADAVEALSLELAGAADAKCASATLLSALLADTGHAGHDQGRPGPAAPQQATAAAAAVASPAAASPGGASVTGSGAARRVQALAAGLQVSSAAELDAARATSALRRRVLVLQQELTASSAHMPGPGAGATAAATSQAMGDGTAGSGIRPPMPNVSPCTARLLREHTRLSSELAAVVGVAAIGAPPASGEHPALPCIAEGAPLSLRAEGAASTGSSSPAAGLRCSFAFGTPPGAGGSGGGALEPSLSISFGGSWAGVASGGLLAGLAVPTRRGAVRGRRRSAASASGGGASDGDSGLSPAQGDSGSPAFPAPAWLQRPLGFAHASTQTAMGADLAPTSAVADAAAQRVAQLEGRLVLLQQQALDAEMRAGVAAAARDALQAKLAAARQEAGNRDPGTVVQPPLASPRDATLRALQEQVTQQAARIEQLQLALAAARAAAGAPASPGSRSGSHGSLGYGTPASGSLGSRASTPAKSPRPTAGRRHCVPPLPLFPPAMPIASLHIAAGVASSPVASPGPAQACTLQQPWQQEQQRTPSRPVPPGALPLGDGSPVWGLNAPAADAQLADGGIKGPPPPQGPAFGGWSQGGSVVVGALAASQSSAASSLASPGSSQRSGWGGGGGGGARCGTPTLTPRSTRPGAWGVGAPLLSPRCTAPPRSPMTAGSAAGAGSGWR